MSIALPWFQPVAPDGQPPLAFVLNTASFVVVASVPIGVICLGSALACLRLRPAETFPQGAITALALARMVVMPLLGVGITRWLVHAGFVDRDDKALQFVLDGGHTQSRGGAEKIIQDQAPFFSN